MVSCGGWFLARVSPATPSSSSDSKDASSSSKPMLRLLVEDVALVGCAQLQEIIGKGVCCSAGGLCTAKSLEDGVWRVRVAKGVSCSTLFLEGVGSGAPAPKRFRPHVPPEQSHVLSVAPLTGCLSLVSCVPAWKNWCLKRTAVAFFLLMWCSDPAKSKMLAMILLSLPVSIGAR